MSLPGVNLEALISQGLITKLIDCFDKTKGWISSDKVSCKRAMFVIALEVPSGKAKLLDAVLAAGSGLDCLPPRIQEVYK